MPALSTPRPAASLLFLLPALLLTAGCASLMETRDRPEALAPVPVDASPRRAYDEALTVAFNRGYNIAYTDEGSRLIELEVLERAFLFPDRVRRIDLFVREHDGRTYLHSRVHSFEANDPGDIDVTDDDRDAARQLVDVIAAALQNRSLRRDPS